jgi:hypothetical protein
MNCALCRSLLVILCLCLLQLSMGCDNSGSLPPLAAETDANIGANDPVDCSSKLALDWDAWYQASNSIKYSSLSDDLDGTYGDVLTGSVTGYTDLFGLVVPAGAYPGIHELEMLVPTGGKPIYQLLPHGKTFSVAVTVILDYSKWLASGYLTAGNACEVLYMNEAIEEFESLSPPATFTVSSTNTTISFQTDHFSRWVLSEEKGD